VPTSPKTNKTWAKEIEIALKDASELVQETQKEIQQQLQGRLFVSAPVIAMKNRNIDFRKRQDVVDYACESIVSMLREYPALQDKHKRCFVHAYIDAHIYLKLYKQSKSQDLFYYLESKNIIES